MIIPNVWKNQESSKPPTRLVIVACYPHDLGTPHIAHMTLIWPPNEPHSASRCIEAFAWKRGRLCPMAPSQISWDDPWWSFFNESTTSLWASFSGHDISKFLHVLHSTFQKYANMLMKLVLHPHQPSHWPNDQSHLFAPSNTSSHLQWVIIAGNLGNGKLPMYYVWTLRFFSHSSLPMCKVLPASFDDTRGSFRCECSSIFFSVLRACLLLDAHSSFSWAM